MFNYKNFQDIIVGNKISYAKTITTTEIYLGAGLVGSLNPIHIDEEYCKKTRFQKRIAVGIQVSFLPVTVAQNFLVGLGTTLVSLDVKFVAPVYLGDTIQAEVEILKKDSQNKIITFKDTLTNQDGKIVNLGEFSLKLPEVDYNIIIKN